MIYVGIDPGVGGAIAVLRKNKVKIYDVPVYIKKVNRRRIREYDIPACKMILETIFADRSNKSVAVWLEAVHAMPLNGCISNFSMGRGRGLWEGMIAGLGYHVHLVSPATWKAEFFPRKKHKSKKKKSKQADIKKALKILPRMKKYLKLKKHHDRADAALIAEYGRRQ